MMWIFVFCLISACFSAFAPYEYDFVERKISNGIHVVAPKEIKELLWIGSDVNAFYSRYTNASLWQKFLFWVGCKNDLRKQYDILQEEFAKRNSPDNPNGFTAMLKNSSEEQLNTRFQHAKVIAHLYSCHFDTINYKMSERIKVYYENHTVIDKIALLLRAAYNDKDISEISGKIDKMKINEIIKKIFQDDKDSFFHCKGICAKIIENFFTQEELEKTPEQFSFSLEDTDQISALTILCLPFFLEPNSLNNIVTDCCEKNNFSKLVEIFYGINTEYSILRSIFNKQINTERLDFFTKRTKYYTIAFSSICGFYCKFFIVEQPNNHTFNYSWSKMQKMRKSCITEEEKRRKEEALEQLNAVN